MQLTFLLCDDLLNPTLVDAVANYEAVCLIKSCGEQISFTPIIKQSESKNYIQKLQQRLKHNNPTLALLEAIDINANLMLPYLANEVLPEKAMHVLQEQLCSQLTENNARPHHSEPSQC